MVILGGPAMAYQLSTQAHLKRRKDSDQSPMWPWRGREERGVNLRWAQCSGHTAAHSGHPTPAEKEAAGELCETAGLSSLPA